jgi:general secretion pathway protein C
VREDWKAHPEAFTVSGLIQLRVAMRALLTRQQLDRIAAKAREKVEAGELPTDASQLGLSTAELTDAWGKEVALVEEGDVLKVVSHGAGVSVEVPIPPQARSAAAPKTGACGSETHFVFTRAERDAALSDVKAFAGTVRVVPNFVSGKANGFKLFALHEGSGFARMGLCNGDVVHSVGGLDLTSPERALEVYSRVKEAAHLELAVTRRGTPLTLTLDFQ